MGCTKCHQAIGNENLVDFLASSPFRYRLKGLILSKMKALSKTISHPFDVLNFVSSYNPQKSNHKSLLCDFVEPSTEIEIERLRFDRTDEARLGRGTTGQGKTL